MSPFKLTPPARKRYLFFLGLGPISNLLWACWALPEIGEQGGFIEMLEWLVVQSLIPVLLILLLLLGRRYILWVVASYGVVWTLHGIGTLGWALMGPATPFSVYVVACFLVVMGFGLMTSAFMDLNLGKKERPYETRDE